jgi:hypothetical protein
MQVVFQTRQIERKTSTNRSAKGSMLIESACGTIVFVIVAVALIAGGINIYSFIVNSQKVQIAANAAAQVANNARFWLGTYRPNFRADDAQTNATAAANAILAEAGLPACTVELFEPAIQGNSSTGYNGFVVSHVRLSVPGLQFPFANTIGFPSVFNVTADGYSAATSFTPYAACTLGIPRADGRGRRRIQIPVIGYGNQITGEEATNGTSGGSGSAVAGGTYFGSEVDLPGATVTNDRLVIVDTRTTPNTFSAQSF